MRFAQRGTGFHEQAQQQVEIITGDSPEEVGVKISVMVADYAIRVVSMTSFTNQAYPPHGAVVVFEEEVDQS